MSSEQGLKCPRCRAEAVATLWYDTRYVCMICAHEWERTVPVCTESPPPTDPEDVVEEGCKACYYEEDDPTRIPHTCDPTPDSEALPEVGNSEVVERLEAIRDRLEKTTGKRWFWNSYSGIWATEIPDGSAFALSDERQEQVASVYDPENVYSPGDELRTREAKGNADFIAHAREDTPWLLTLIHDLQAKNARLLEGFRVSLSEDEGKDANRVYREQNNMGDPYAVEKAVEVVLFTRRQALIGEQNDG